MREDRAKTSDQFHTLQTRVYDPFKEGPVKR